MTLNTMISTIIATITSFLNKILETSHILFIERDILEALGIWTSYPRGIGGIYIRHSYYNTVYRPFWSLDRLTFPIRYYLSSKLNCLYEWIDSIKTMIVTNSPIKKDETRDFEDSKINIHKSASDHNGTDNDIMFPMEIWEVIAHIGNIDNLIMMSINRSFLYTFAPKIYDTLKLTIVLSPLTKMKLTDECFLKKGPDTIRDKHYDSYSIYKRHQESQKFDYEFLDTSIITDQDFFEEIHLDAIKRHKHFGLFKSEDRGERSNHPFEIRSLKNIQFILKNILQNPNSIMKKFIKEILLDICVFDGFDKLMTFEQNSLVNGSTRGQESLDELIDQQIEKNELVSVMTDQNEYLHVTPLDDNFDRVRWKDPLEDKAPRFGRVLNNIQTKFTRESIISDIYHIFPQNVYFKELLSVYLLSDQSYSNILRRRLSKFKNSMDFQNANPVIHWFRTLVDNCSDRITNEFDVAGCFKMIVTGQSCVKITNREFKTELQVNEILNDLIKILTNVEPINIEDDDANTGLNHIETSILILGINDGKPQVSKEFTLNASMNEDPSDPSCLLPLEPELILINKPATINNLQV
ncbi:hypothetical protein BN7_264 [Wickerhamomyces ciferrii]|uniref:Uncharacterized protein n=1 Tax=Wickerhamomyces ciferrii (strain ATCC 14091 / BCRC 22168 / CBS 111 / JCM 3599 / NBRC 0793 / NRRL Y-1031 F-60-10) TaxID=1206466 RepID=K0K7C4_WICCF|nr:uncharacterized protein BN7_264 [Wickerhamomyces ciferrii]CCH40730.1 hypothetical protein BN7_264 [Wickerhamomyces ciferrii]